MPEPNQPPTTAPGPRYDVFNGDADGLCALQQLRLAGAPAGTLVTGVKRDVRLLAGLEAPPGSVLTVLDVSLAANRTDLERLLAGGCQVRWFDHHQAGEVPSHPALETHLDPDPALCTSLLVDRYLESRPSAVGNRETGAREGTHRAWAVVGAFGDNLSAAARRAAAPLQLPPETVDALRILGELLNYNGYGEQLADLHFHPARLFEALRPYADPLAFMQEAPEPAVLRAGMAADLEHADRLSPVHDGPGGRVVLLPGEPWARRVQGVLANHLANERPEAAVGLGLPNTDGTLKLSVRAPLERPHGADALCSSFAEGGGRAGAGGISRLPPGELDAFIAAFARAFP